MAKTFAPRVSKKNRETLEVSESLKERFKNTEDYLLKGARLEEMNLSDIVVKDQVRTKFNDSSIKELSDNIRTNGLIQPLVVYKERGKFTLICGERRFRAMSLIDEMKSCPCYILENKTSEELMAIQFSENSSREALHYIDRADGILNYQKATSASERKITKALGISKTEVHRSLLIAKLPKKIKEAAKIHNTEKYVLVEYFALENTSLKKQIAKMITSGEITKRAHLKRVLSGGTLLKAGKKVKSRKAPALPKGMSANALLKAMKSKSKDLDPETRKALEALMDETSSALK